MSFLAEAIAEADPSVDIGIIDWDRFEDKFPNLMIHRAADLPQVHAVFLASLHSPDTVFEQLAVMHALPRHLVAKYTIVLPYYPTGTMERERHPGQVATAKSLARLISTTPLALGGPATLHLFDIHNITEQFYFGDQILPVLNSCIPLLLARLRALSVDADGIEPRNVAICFPDLGAQKRFAYYFAHEYGGRLVACRKARTGRAGRRVDLVSGHVQGRDIVIVDDLVKTGSTLMECAALCHAAGARTVSIFVTHGVFPQRSWVRFLPPDAPQRLDKQVSEASARDPDTSADANAVAIHTFWVTDTHPTAASLADVRPFEVLSIATLVKDLVLDPSKSFSTSEAYGDDMDEMNPEG